MGDSIATSESKGPFTMISGVVATLDATSDRCASTVSSVADHPLIEVGAMPEMRRLPMTIESVDQQEMEETTRWLQDLPAVLFVDIVFVHLEN